MSSYIHTREYEIEDVLIEHITVKLRTSTYEFVAELSEDENGVIFDTIRNNTNTHRNSKLRSFGGIEFSVDPVIVDRMSVKFNSDQHVDESTTESFSSLRQHFRKIVVSGYANVTVASHHVTHTDGRRVSAYCVVTRVELPLQTLVFVSGS